MRIGNRVIVPKTFMLRIHGRKGRKRSTHNRNGREELLAALEHEMAKSHSKIHDGAYVVTLVRVG